MNTYKIKEKGRTLIYKPIKRTPMGRVGTLVGYIRDGKRHMYALIAAAALIFSVVSMTGCAGIYKPAAIVVVTAEKAMTSYGDYFDAAIANPTKYNTTADKLWKQRADVSKIWEGYRTAMNAVDDTRKAGGDVNAALTTAQKYSDQLVNLVLSFLPNEFKPSK